MVLFAAGMRRAALQMPSRFFVCNQCLRQTPRRSPSPILNIVRSRGYADAKPLESLAAQNASAAAALAQSQAAKAFPKKTTSKGVAIWLLGSAASVFGIVVFGGLTRLTESGYGSPGAGIGANIIMLSY
jgi:cytochrome c oxidase assembly protein subunit 15